MGQAPGTLGPGRGKILSPIVTGKKGNDGPAGKTICKFGGRKSKTFLSKGLLLLWCRKLEAPLKVQCRMVD